MLQYVSTLPSFTVPLHADLDSRLRWMEGLCDDSGVIITNEKHIHLRLALIDLEFGRKVRLMLQTMGCNSRIESLYRSLAFPGHYCRKEIYHLNVSACELKVLSGLGWKPKRLHIDVIQLPDRDDQPCVEVIGITYIPGTYATYCFTEPFLKRGCFNGIRTGNCSEITLLRGLTLSQNTLGVLVENSEYAT